MAIAEAVLAVRQVEHIDGPHSRADREVLPLTVEHDVCAIRPCEIRVDSAPCLAVEFEQQAQFARLDVP